MPKRRASRQVRTPVAARGRAARPGSAQAPKHRRKAAAQGTARSPRVAGAKRGTLRGRSRRKPPRKPVPRSAAERRARAEMLFGAMVP